MYLKAATRLLPAWLWLLMALAVALGGGWLWHQADTARLKNALVGAQSQVEVLRQARDAWAARADRYEADLERIRRQHRQARQAVERLQGELAAIDRQAGTRRQRIQAAPAEDDGPVAPVLRMTLEALP